MLIDSTARLRRYILATSAICASLAALPARADTAPAHAAAAAPADAADGSGEQLADIVVTAQKRETNLQKTPISISVLSGSDLADRHAISLESLGDGSIPSLKIAPAFSRSSALTVGIRGIGLLGDSQQPSRDQGVGVYIDGVYLGRVQGLGSALYDVERIEVLKGPQGSLFGRNTEGGAISIVTKRPSGEWHLNATVGVGNYHGREAAVHLDLPAVGNFSVKLDGILQKRGGTVDNPLRGAHDFNSYDKQGIHAAVLWEPSSSFNALYSFDISRDDTTPYYVQLISKGSLPLAPAAPVQPDRVDAATIGVPLDLSQGRVQGHQLTLDWKIAPQLEVKSISSYRKLSQSQLDNGAANLSVFAPNAPFSRYSIANYWQNQYSEELQLLGTFPQVTFVVGGYFYHENVNDNAWTPFTNKWNADGTGYTILPTPVGQTPFPDRASHATTESLGAFGQATYTPDFLNRKAHLTLGGRYTHDSKTGTLDKVNGALPVVNGVAAIVPFKHDWGRFDPTINLAYDLTGDVHVYAKYSTGYKAGGANSRSLTYRTFNPESVSSYEIGAKTEFLDHRARLNVAAFTASYKDVQLDFNAVIAGSNRGTIETVNAAGAGRTRGFEAELTLLPFRGLTLTGNYAYTQVRLPEAPNPFVAGNPLIAVFPIYTPNHAASVAGDYETPIGDLKARLHLDANFAASQYTMVSDPTKTGSSMIVNGRLSLGGVRMAGTGAELTFALWTRNLTNYSYTFVRSHSAALGTYAIYNEPRTFGFQANVKF